MSQRPPNRDDEEILARVLAQFQQATPAPPARAAELPLNRPTTALPPQQVTQPPPINQQPYVMAEQLEQQAQPSERPGGWRGIGESVMRGLASTGHPGGYHGYAADQAATERQRQQDLLGRATRLRSEGMARDQMNIEADRFSQQQNLRQDELSLSRDQFARAKEIQDRPKGTNYGPGQTYGIEDPQTGRFTSQGTTPTAPTRDTSLQPFEAWRQQNPNAPISDWVALNRAPVQGREPDFEWVIRNNAPLQIRKGTAQPGDRPYSADAAKPGSSPTGSSPYSKERAARTVQSVDELLNRVSSSTVGYGNLLAGIPATDARNFQAEVDTLKANIAFNELTEMREASKTGGALGQVSNIELGLLQSALGALDLRQSPANFKSQLEKIKGSIQRWEAAQAAASTGNNSSTGSSNTGQRIRVRNRETGQTGTISEAAFNPAKYERIP